MLKKSISENSGEDKAYDTERDQENPNSPATMDAQSTENGRRNEELTAEALKDLRGEERGDSDLYTNLNKDELVYDYMCKKWHVWNGNHWDEDPSMHRVYEGFDKVIAFYDGAKRWTQEQIAGFSFGLNEDALPPISETVFKPGSSSKRWMKSDVKRLLVENILPYHTSMLQVYDTVNYRDTTGTFYERATLPVFDPEGNCVELITGFHCRVMSDYNDKENIEQILQAHVSELPQLMEQNA